MYYWAALYADGDNEVRLLGGVNVMLQTASKLLAKPRQPTVVMKQLQDVEHWGEEDQGLDSCARRRYDDLAVFFFVALNELMLVRLGCKVDQQPTIFVAFGLCLSCYVIWIRWLQSTGGCQVRVLDLFSFLGVALWTIFKLLYFHFLSNGNGSVKVNKKSSIGLIV